MSKERQDELLATVASGNFDSVGSPAQQAALDYAMRLTIAPSEVTEADVKKLRSHGFSDLAIHDLCSITAYFAFVNRIADGLGVELESDASS